MLRICHTCGGELAAAAGESPFCPHCGAPQLYLSLDYQSAETGGEVGTAGAASTGVVPPPRPRQVDWQMAIRCAVAVAAVAGILSAVAARVDLLTPLSTLWILSGPLIALGFYQRQRPSAWMDAGVGARIGLVVGMCVAIGVAVPMAAIGLVERYGLKAMGGFDLQMAEQIQTMQKTLQQQAPVPAEMVRLFNSPEFRAAIVLAGFAMLSGFLLLLSTLGGAFAGLLRTRRRASA